MFVALVIQHAEGISLITLSSVVVRRYHIFPPYLIKHTIFGGGGIKILNINAYFDFPYKFSLKNVSF
jgi:hypothetical protein